MCYDEPLRLRNILRKNDIACSGKKVVGINKGGEGIKALSIAPSSSHMKSKSDQRSALPVFSVAHSIGGSKHKRMTLEEMQNKEYVVILVVSCLVLRFFNNNIQRHKHQNKTLPADKIELCANCGKEGSNMNTCNKCKEATYCNAACKKKHRSTHKKQCDRRVAELHDEGLFKEPPPQHGDCPICFIRLPTMGSGRRYMSCCGKMICSGCDHAPVYDDQGIAIVEKKCPFCRTPPPTTEEFLERIKKRMEVGDTCAFEIMGNVYLHGRYGVPQDSAKFFFARQESLDTIILAMLIIMVTV